MATLPLVSTVNPLALGFENKLIAGPFSVSLWLEYVTSHDEVIVKLNEGELMGGHYGPQLYVHFDAI